MLFALPGNVRQEPKASVLSAYKICDLAYKIFESVGQRAYGQFKNKGYQPI
jgi:hypothetical protein